jgi:hypothetical protein
MRMGEIKRGNGLSCCRVHLRLGGAADLPKPAIFEVILGGLRGLGAALRPLSELLFEMPALRHQIDPEPFPLIRWMWQADPSWGRRRIWDELAKLGLHLFDSTIRGYCPKPQWSTPQA